MWILDFLPDAFFHLILIIGITGIIAGFLLSFIPIVNQYKLPIQVVSILLFSIGLWYEGGIAKDREWKEKVAELEKKLAIAKAESEKVNTEIITQVVTQKQIIKEKGKTVIEYVDREVIKYDNTCAIPEVVINAHNAAATNDTTLLKSGSEIDTSVHNALVKSKIKLAPKK
jgi:hypothetical protein